MHSDSRPATLEEALCYLDESRSGYLSTIHKYYMYPDSKNERALFANEHDHLQAMTDVLHATINDPDLPYDDSLNVAATFIKHEDNLQAGLMYKLCGHQQFNSDKRIGRETLIKKALDTAAHTEGLDPREAMLDSYIATLKEDIAVFCIQADVAVNQLYSGERRSRAGRSLGTLAAKFGNFLSQRLAG